MYAYVREIYQRAKIIIPPMTITNYAGFANQPDDDGVEIVSNSASDVGPCTVWGTDHDTGVLVSETVTLTGTDAVSTLKTDWGNIIGVFLGEANGSGIVPAVGTITIREASHNGAITTITAGNFQKGVFVIDAPGRDVDVINASGKIYWNTVQLATAANGYYHAGATQEIFHIGVKERLHIVSDNTGCVTQVVVMEA